MNILFLSRLFYPHIGGVEKHVFELSKRLVEQGHTVTIISENTLDSFDNLTREQRTILKSFSIHYIRVKDGRLKKFQIWKWIREHKELFDTADIIHCHDVFFWIMPYRLTHPFKKIYTTFHGYESYPISKKSIIIRKISETLSNGNICIGDFIPKWYKTKPTLISYGAVEINEEPKYPRVSSAFFFGRLDEQTGVLMYRDALLKIREVYPSFTLHIVGDGKYKKNLLAVKGITVEPFTPNVKPYLQKHKFIFVSRYLSMLEALAEKRYVFAVFDNPVKEDYLKMSPFAKYSYIAGSATNLAKQVISVIEDEVRAEKRVKEGHSFAGMQSWEKLVKDYLFLWTNAKRKRR